MSKVHARQSPGRHLTYLPASETFAVRRAAQKSGFRVRVVGAPKDQIQVVTDEEATRDHSPFWKAWREMRGDE